MVSALVWGTRGRRFESGRPDSLTDSERSRERQGADLERVWTIPNVLSFLRLASVPPFLWLWLNDQRDLAVVLYAIGASTDFFDGYIARKTNSVTELGKVLDPLADRVFIVTLTVALIAAGVLPWWLAAVILVRDLAIVVAFPILERRGVERVAVNFTGKSATAALFSGLTLLALAETSLRWAGDLNVVGLLLVGLGAVLYWVAAVQYAKEALRKLEATKGGEA